MDFETIARNNTEMARIVQTYYRTDGIKKEENV